MTTTTGVLTVSDLLKVKNASAVEFGLDKIYNALAADLSSYNQQVTEMVGEFCEKTILQGRVFDGSSGYAFQEVDEFGIPRGQKDFGRYEVQWPVKKFVAGLSWTMEHFNMATPAEIANEYDKVQLADQKNIVKMIKQAIFNNANYTFLDKHYNQQSLTVRRAWNADGVTPFTTTGSGFQSDHTHFITRVSTLANTDVDSAISLVTEHDLFEDIRIFINGANVSDLSGISSTEYKELRSALMIPSTASDATVDTLSVADLNNYQAGIWNGRYPVLVRPFVPEDYILIMALGGDKPLAWRELPYPAMQGLKLDSIVNSAPMVCQSASRYAGVGQNNRSALSVLYIGNTTWANPTIS